MNKDEILAKSRQENKNMDERERDAYARAGRIGSAVGGMTCALIAVLEAIFSDGVSMSVWAVFLSITGTTLLVKYLRLKKPHELIFGLIELALAATFLVMHVIRLVG